VLTEKARSLGERLWGLWQPAPEIKLSEWSEKHIVLPEGSSARPGELRNWPYMVEILDSMGDDSCERVSVMKSARLGYTKGLMFAIAATVATRPSGVILLTPTDDDAKGTAADEVEPIFEATPELRALMKKSTALRKTFLGGASLKILSAVAPRKLRRHDARVLLIDEADAMVLTKEGDAIKLAEKRTFAHADRKIIMGSTPTEEGVSAVEQAYNASDMRVYEVPCPECGTFSEIVWENIEWEPDRPETAKWQCPSCRELISERWKPQMVAAGRWRATKPEVERHKGYRMSALISLLANASWPKLAAEYIEAKRQGPAYQQVFANTVLGRPWRMTLHRVDADTLMERAEPWGLGHENRAFKLPAEVMLITVGADVQDDRIEATVCGWRAAGGAPLVLGHLVFDGNTLEPEVWKELDAWSKTRWRHPNGWRIGIDGMAVDSGGSEGRTQKVYDWCAARAARRIYAIKGRAGAHKIWERAKKVKGDYRLVNVAVDMLKTMVMDGIGRPGIWMDDNNRVHEDLHGVRFSDQLPDDWYEQVTNETRRIKYKGNRAEIVFELKRQGLRVEGLDCLVYAWAVRQAPSVRSIDLKARSMREPEDEGKPKPRVDPGAWAAAFNS
jgi:phage terminase large subunit GpA-like protein